MLDRLEAADRLAELLAVLGVVDRLGGGRSRDAGELGRRQDGGPPPDRRPSPRRPRACDVGTSTNRERHEGVERLLLGELEAVEADQDRDLVVQQQRDGRADVVGDPEAVALGLGQRGTA